MSETKFTPGPWETDFYNVEDYGVYMVKDSLNQAVCQCFTQYYSAGKPGITDDEAEANARLITAAPEMYAALQKIASMTPGTSCDTDDGCSYYESECGTCNEMIAIAQDVLRKACGESEVPE